MSQKILISIHIGSSSAAAAIMLSGQENPTLVNWPPYNNPIVPLRVSYGENGEQFKWGKKATPNVESDTLFGIPFDSTGEVLHELYRKRGRHGYHLRWSLYHDPQLRSIRSFTLFLRAMRVHILKALESTYGSASTMEKLVCLVIPIYFERDRDFEQILLNELRFDSSGMLRVIQPQAALAFCATEEREKINPSDVITVCHMEEEVTTISRLGVKQKEGEWDFEFEILDSSIIVIGLFDVVDRFEAHLEGRFESAIVSTEGESVEGILEEIAQLKDKFCEGLHKRYVTSSESFKLRRRIAPDAAGIPGSRLTIKRDEMRRMVFDPVLAAIFDKLDPDVNLARGKQYILFSGVLGECPYVHSYMREQFAAASRTIEILETADENTSSCQGAVFLLDKATRYCDPSERAAAIHTTLESRLEYMRIIEAGLDYRRQMAESQADYNGLLRKYEMILSERIWRQGFDNQDTKTTTLSIESIHREMGNPDQSLEQCKAFVEGYTSEMKLRLSLTDVQQQFSAIHLAAASNDHLALRIILAAGHSVHDLVEGCPFKHFDHTALHIYAWYNSNPNECVNLLINAGAVALPVGGEPNRSPAHIAASKGHVQLLRAFENHYGRQSIRDYQGLLELATAEGQRETAKYLLDIGAPVSLEGTLVDFSPLAGVCKRKILPLSYALEHAWTDVATILINRRIASLNGNEGFTPMLCPAVTGREAMGRLLVRWADIDTDGTDESGQTQLSWAARLGYEGVVQFLVDWEQIAADSKDKSGRTPLSWAASNGHMSVVQTLVRWKDVAANSRDAKGKTPLFWAAREGQEAVVRLLLEKGADVAAASGSGKTALYAAARRGHKAVVRLLLDSGAVIAAKDSNDQTALYRAAFQGHKEVVQLLLEKGADIAAKDSNGQTALHWAAFQGHKEVVQLLLEKGADIAGKGYNSQTALYQAARWGHKEVVQLLLKEGANIDAKDSSSWTALHRAAFEGHKAVVQLLLEKGADIAAKDSNDQTALHWAAFQGHKEVVQLLLEKGTDIAAKESIGQTALHLAAFQGHKAVVQLLLEKGTDIAAKNSNGQTALHLAAFQGHKEVVQLLLEKGADVAAKGYNSQTALYQAARWGHKEVVQLLLKKGANIDTKDSSSWTALHRAAFQGHKAVVQLLLEKGADITAKLGNGRTALHVTAIEGHKEVVQLLLKKGANIATKDSYSWTALHYAAHWGRKEVVQLLLENSADIATKEGNGRTALHWAAWEGHKEVVQLLLENSADIAAKDSNCQTALHWAAGKGHKEVVQLLLEKGADIAAKDSNGDTALRLAAVNMRQAVVQLLTPLTPNS